MLATENGVLVLCVCVVWVASGDIRESPSGGKSNVIYDVIII